jgi:Holliday junction resolvase RusA-like endonuclease
MTDTRRFTIPGKPCSKGRPRFARMGNFVRAYTPKSTASYENLVKLSYIGACRQPAYPAGVPLRLSVVAYFEIPKSWSKKRKAETVWHTSKPDGDNIAKTMDALNGIAWHDDSQVAVLHVEKHMTDDWPRTEIEIREVQNGDS